jgi:oligopeptide/dipeptide ABC transporter ATP-binding protein
MTAEQQKMDLSQNRNERFPLLKISGLCKDFPSGGLLGEDVRVIDNVDMEVYPGETRGIVGESGSGKTTLARCGLRLIEPSSGKVWFDGQDLTSLSPASLRGRRKEFQMIFQDAVASLNPGMTVRQVLLEPLKIHNIGDRDSRHLRVQELLESVSLSASLIERQASELSGGQQQRLGIARGIALKPRLLIADEPVSALDASVQAQILNLLGDLKKKFDLTLVLISHSLHAVHYLCDYISVLYKGRLIEDSPASSFFKEPKHPYSRMLLKALPAPGHPDSGSSSFVPAATIPPQQPNPGCAFYNYCPYRLPICRDEAPPLLRLNSREKAACFLFSA